MKIEINKDTNVSCDLISSFITILELAKLLQTERALFLNPEQLSNLSTKEDNHTGSTNIEKPK